MDTLFNEANIPNADAFDEEEYIDGEMLIEKLVSEENYSELVKYLTLFSSDEELQEFAFREAIRQGRKDYITEHINDFELNHNDDINSYIDETDNEDMISFLMEYCT